MIFDAKKARSDELTCRSWLCPRGHSKGDVSLVAAVFSPEHKGRLSAWLRVVVG